MSRPIPERYSAYFATRLDAERAAADLDDEFLSQVERVERPWALRSARPAGDPDEAGDHQGEFEAATRPLGGEDDPADGVGLSPLHPERREPFRFSSDEGSAG